MSFYSALKKYIQQVKCRHLYVLHHNMYAGERQAYNYRCSMWICTRCENYTARKVLVKECLVCAEDFIGLSLHEARLRTPATINISASLLPNISEVSVIVTLDRDDFILTARTCNLTLT